MIRLTGSESGCEVHVLDDAKVSKIVLIDRVSRTQRIAYDAGVITIAIDAGGDFESVLRRESDLNSECDELFDENTRLKRTVRALRKKAKDKKRRVADAVKLLRSMGCVVTTPEAKP